MHIAFYLYSEYKEAVLGNVQLSIDSLLFAFKYDYQNSSKIMHLEERLFILEKLLPFIDYKKAFELLECIKKLLFEEPETNFIVFCLNPLKIVTMLMSVISQLRQKYALLTFQIDHLQKALDKTGYYIIKNSKSVQDVEDMVTDKLYNGVEILDMLAYLDSIPLLQYVLWSVSEGVFPQKLDEF